ncbi:hypothetical protein ABR737_01475 [Streptomyces sp. Edi2]|uniref:hypothetical protein n=1 Tax=Streptomyces sp. Edi2 TaxID=3162528 RepID=UPI00330576E9
MSIQSDPQQFDTLIETATPDQLRAALRAVRSEIAYVQQPLTYTDFPTDGSPSPETEVRHAAQREMGEGIDGVVRAALLARP